MQISFSVSSVIIDDEVSGEYRNHAVITAGCVVYNVTLNSIVC